MLRQAPSERQFPTFVAHNGNMSNRTKRPPYPTCLSLDSNSALQGAALEAFDLMGRNR